MHKAPIHFRNLLWAAEEFDSLPDGEIISYNPTQRKREEEKSWKDYELYKHISRRNSGITYPHDSSSFVGVTTDCGKFDACPYEYFIEENSDFIEEDSDELSFYERPSRSSSYRRCQARHARKSLLRTSKIVAKNLKVRIQEDKNNKSFCRKRGEKYVKSRTATARALIKKAQKHSAV